MKNKEEFKRRLKDSEFLSLFSGATSSKDIAKIAQQQGYDVTAEDVRNTTLSDDILESVAGGKGDLKQSQSVNGTANGVTFGNQTGSTKVDPSTNITTDLTIPTKGF